MFTSYHYCKTDLILRCHQICLTANWKESWWKVSNNRVEWIEENAGDKRSIHNKYLCDKAHASGTSPFDFTGFMETCGTLLSLLFGREQAGGKWVFSLSLNCIWFERRITILMTFNGPNDPLHLLPSTFPGIPRGLPPSYHRLASPYPTSRKPKTNQKIANRAGKGSERGGSYIQTGDISQGLGFWEAPNAVPVRSATGRVTSAHPANDHPFPRKCSFLILGSMDGEMRGKRKTKRVKGEVGDCALGGGYGTKRSAGSGPDVISEIPTSVNLWEFLHGLDGSVLCWGIAMMWQMKQNMRS